MTRFAQPHFTDESYKEILAVITSAGYKPLRVDEADKAEPLKIHTAQGGGECYGSVLR